LRIDPLGFGHRHGNARWQSQCGAPDISSVNDKDIFSSANFAVSAEFGAKAHGAFCSPPHKAL
jgi:hypothetical protein